MQGWRVVVLVNVALAVGLGAGYLVWGARLAAAEAAAQAAQAQAEKTMRERDALLSGGKPGEQLWQGRGVVRAIYPRLAIVTHEEIAGMLPARTTSFRLSETLDRTPLRPGAAIRFWLIGPSFSDNSLVRAEPW